MTGTILLYLELFLLRQMDRICMVMRQQSNSEKTFPRCYTEPNPDGNIPAKITNPSMIRIFHIPLSLSANLRKACTSYNIQVHVVTGNDFLLHVWQICEICKEL